MEINPRALRHHSARTKDGVTIHFVTAGNPDGPPVLFVHGISQSWQSWQKQLDDELLGAQLRLIALDLRGHGASQGARSQDASLAPLPPDRYNDGSPGDVARLWASDIEAVVDACNLSNVTLVGWSYGGAVVLDYLHVNRGLGAAGKVVLVATTPVLQPPGTPHVGADSIFTPRAVTALMRTTPADFSRTPPRKNEPDDIAQGLHAYLEACLDDGTGQPMPTASEVAAMASFNLLVDPSVRLSVMARAFDYRDFLASLPPSTLEKITAVTPLADRVLQSARTRTLWPSGLTQVLFERQGHLCFWRSPDDLRRILLHAV